MPIKNLSLSALLALSIGMPATLAQAQAEFYVFIEGATRNFPSESSRKGHENRVVGLTFEHVIKSPRDAVSGLASGKRQHGPVTFTKDWGAASPQLFLALVSNETLKAVTFEFFQVNSAGMEELATVIKLTDASVSQIRKYWNPGSDLRSRPREEVSFTYRTIEIQHMPTKSIAMDTWGEAPQ